MVNAPEIPVTYRRLTRFWLRHTMNIRRTKQGNKKKETKEKKDDETEKRRIKRNTEMNIASVSQSSP